MRLDGHVSPLPRSYMVSLGALAVWIKTGCHDFCPFTTTILLVLYRLRFQELTTKNKNPKPGDLNSPKLTKKELGRSRHEVSLSPPVLLQSPYQNGTRRAEHVFNGAVNRVPLYTHVYLYITDYYRLSPGLENQLQVPSPQLAIHFAAARKPPLCSAVRRDTSGQHFISHSTAFSTIDLATFFLFALSLHGD